MVAWNIISFHNTNGKVVFRPPEETRGLEVITISPPFPSPPPTSPTLPLLLLQKTKEAQAQLLILEIYRVVMYSSIHSGNAAFFQVLIQPQAYVWGTVQTRLISSDGYYGIFHFKGTHSYSGWCEGMEANRTCALAERIMGEGCVCVCVCVCVKNMAWLRLKYWVLEPNCKDKQCGYNRWSTLSKTKQITLEEEKWKEMHENAKVDCFMMVVGGIKNVLYVQVFL